MDTVGTTIISLKHIPLYKKKCEHNQRKSQCKECKGSSICEHNRRKNECKECKGSRICEHNIQKTSCMICSKLPTL